jgi:type II secretory pathway pseudopilin PulG
MIEPQRTGALAVIGGLTALIALEAGLPSARADQLSDLQGQIQLLQQRVDQLSKEQEAQQPSEQQAAVLGGPVVAGAPSIAGSFPRSFLIPGTNTSIAISGYIKFDAAEWFHGGSASYGTGTNPSGLGLTVVARLPLNLKGPAGTIFATPAYNNAARSNFIFHDSAAESRLRVETRTPTPYGQVGTVLEFDFYGCIAQASGGTACQGLDDGTSPLLPRLRLAYATLGGFFAGQGFIPVNDLDAHPELFDFGGDAGTFGFERAPWIGYTWQLPYGTSFQLAAVTPETGFYGPLGALYDDCDVESGAEGPGAAETNCAATGYPINPNKTTLPDLNLVFRDEQPWGHVQLGFVAQRLTLNDGAFLNQNFLGYGGGVSGSVKPDWFGWSKDNFGLNFYMGPGLGHYAAPPGASEPGTVNALATNWGLVGAACDITTGVGCYGNAAGGSTAVTAANAALVRTATVLQYGAEASYQHWWTPNLRSTISGGFQTQDIPTDLVTVAPSDIPFDMVSSNANALQYNKVLITAHLNLIWSPVSFIDTGFEFVWGHRLTILGGTASMDVLDYAFKVKF